MLLTVKKENLWDQALGAHRTPAERDNLFHSGFIAYLRTHRDGEDTNQLQYCGTVKEDNSKDYKTIL